MPRLERDTNTVQREDLKKKMRVNKIRHQERIKTEGAVLKKKMECFPTNLLSSEQNDNSWQQCVGLNMPCHPGRILHSILSVFFVVFLFYAF